jgi:ADP-ribose pyrophosphatase YjhB (NUDIX family)
VRRLARHGYRSAALVRRLYWFAFRPRTQGVKCVIVHEGRWLMIRNSYGRGHWTFPGGGINRGERPRDAAVREVAEEVGIDLADVAPIGTYFTRQQYKRDTVHCFTATVGSADHVIDEAEIAEARWVVPDELPSFRGPNVDAVVGMMPR